MFECSSMFTLRDMKHTMEYPHFQSFYMSNFDGPEKLKYFKMPWIWPSIILFGVYIFLDMIFLKLKEGINEFFLIVQKSSNILRCLGFCHLSFYLVFICF